LQVFAAPESKLCNLLAKYKKQRDENTTPEQLDEKAVNVSIVAKFVKLVVQVTLFLFLSRYPIQLNNKVQEAKGACFDNCLNLLSVIQFLTSNQYVSVSLPVLQEIIFSTLVFRKALGLLLRVNAIPKVLRLCFVYSL
jgi:hypothetical protein